MNAVLVQLVLVLGWLIGRQSQNLHVVIHFIDVFVGTDVFHGNMFISGLLLDREM